jgi:GNAT superfamily N-acetyltransferase
MEQLKAEGCSLITLWVFEANEGAREFYSRFGFAPDGAAATHERTGLTEIRLCALLR